MARVDLAALRRFDDFGHGYAELVLDEDDFAAGDEAVVDIDVDRFAHLAIELEHGAGTKIEQVADFHPGAPQHRGDLHGNVKYGFEVGGAPGRDLRALGLRRRLRHRVFRFQIRQRHLAIIVGCRVAHGSDLVAKSAWGAVTPRRTET